MASRKLEPPANRGRFNLQNAWLPEEARAQASEPAVGGIMMIAGMPMLLDEEMRDPERAFVNRKIT